MSQDRAISFRVLSQMVSLIDPRATLQEAELAEGGHLSVYHLTVKTRGETCKWVLKASLEGGSHGVTTEARLLSILNAHTPLPVPFIIGAVDDHDTLPAPFFLMESAEGTALSKRVIGRLTDKAVERLADQTGTYLADLHALEGPERFGQIHVDLPRSLSGERPSPKVEQLTVTGLQGTTTEISESWPSVMDTWVEEALNRHSSTRFRDLTPGIRSVIYEHLNTLSGPFRPVIGRIDHGLHNLLLDAETGDINTMLDWGFTLSVPAAYDLACVKANLSLEPWSMLPATPDRDQLIRDTMLSAYRDAGCPTVIDQYHAHQDLYELVSLLRAMNNLPEAMPGATQDQIDTVADEYRKVITDRL